MKSRVSVRIGAVVAMVITALSAGVIAVQAAPHAVRADQKYDQNVSPKQVVPVPVPYTPDLGVDVRVLGGDGRLVYPGQEVGFSFHVDRDAYVVIYDIDTEGRTHLLFPREPWDPGFVAGGINHFLPGRGAPYRLVADGPPGEEFIVALASDRPIARRWDATWGGVAGRTEYDDLGGVHVRVGQVTGDRFAAMDRVASRLIEVPTVPGPGCAVARDYVSFFIGDPACRWGGEWRATPPPSPPPPPYRGHPRGR